IEQLAEQSTYLETAFLILFGHLPSQQELDEWTHEITMHTLIHENMRKFMEGFHYDAHPMGMLVSTVAALSTFYSESRDISDPENRKRQIIRLRSEEHTSELQSRENLVCRLLLEKKTDA